jgi:hypothetical protein
VTVFFADPDTPRQIVVFEETGEEREVVRGCKRCGVGEGDPILVVSPSGIAHHVDGDTTNCGIDATGAGWWWSY